MSSRPGEQVVVDVAAGDNEDDRALESGELREAGERRTGGTFDADPARRRRRPHGRCRAPRRGACGSAASSSTVDRERDRARTASPSANVPTASLGQRGRPPRSPPSPAPPRRRPRSEGSPASGGKRDRSPPRSAPFPTGTTTAPGGSPAGRGSRRRSPRSPRTAPARLRPRRTGAAARRPRTPASFASSRSAPMRRSSAPRRSMRAGLVALASAGTKTIAAQAESSAAQAVAAPWFPVDAVTTPARLRVTPRGPGGRPAT